MAGDPRCLVCRGSGLVRDNESDVPCGCAHHAPRDLYALSSAAWLEYPPAALERMRRETDALEQHRLTCSDRPCVRCERMVCACGVPFDGSGKVCPKCSVARRLADALAPMTASVPSRFRWALDADLATLRQRIKLPPERVSKALESPPASDLMLIGGTGSGKTSLVVAMLAAWVRLEPEARGGARFASCYALAGARGRHPLGQGEAPDVKAAMTAPLLVVDDMASEVDDRRNVIAEVIFARHEHEVGPTWVTTGFPVDHLMQRYGTAIVRRLIERRAPVEIGK